MKNGANLVNRRLVQTAAEKGIMVAVHRGSSTCGHIVENTVPAFQCGLRRHADIIELDVVRSVDGQLYVFHDSENAREEERLLGVKKMLRLFSSREIDSLYYRNQYWAQTPEHVNRLDDVLAALKGRCLINVDRSWEYWDSVLPCIERHGMLDQCIVKSDPEPELLHFLEQWETPVMYMSKAYCAEDVENVLRRNINTVAMEVIFFDEQADTLDPVAQKSWHERGLLLWTNALRLREDWNRSAWHDDNGAMLDDPDRHWGWQAEHGFDIIQTDWPATLHEYLVRKGLRRE